MRQNLRCTRPGTCAAAAGAAAGTAALTALASLRRNLLVLSTLASCDSRLCEEDTAATAAAAPELAPLGE